MTKLDPGLLRLADADEEGPREVLAGLSRQPSDRSPENPNVMIELSGEREPAALKKLKFRRRTRAGQVLTGTVPRESIRALEKVPGVTRAEAARVLAGELHKALPEANVVAVHSAPSSIRGANVLVGIIDTGIDFRHRSFRDPGTGRS